MATLLGTTALGVNGANSNNSGFEFSLRLQALASGTITTVGLRVGPTNPNNARCAIYADNAGSPAGAARLSNEIILATTAANAVNIWTISPTVDVVLGSFYWISFLATGGAFSYTDNATTGGTERDTSGLAALNTPHPATTGSFTNIFNVYADGTLATTATGPYFAPRAMPLC